MRAQGDYVVGKWTVIYDGACGVCRWCMALTLTVDRHQQLSPLALQDPRADRLLAVIAREQRATSWHVVSPAGRVYSAGAAIPVLCALLPGFGPLGRLSGAAPNATERIYAGLSGNRHRIGSRLPRAWISWAARRLDERVGRG